MSGLAVKLIVGLGNPGRDYESSRHNAGFWVADELARRNGGAFRLEPKFKAELARARIGGHELWLVKPQDFMNHSGQVTAAVASFYKVEPLQVLVVHDELDLPPGEVRLKEGGGSGGHNGLKDMIAQLGEGFWRLRLGIGHPGVRELVNPWLLARTSAVEREPLLPGVEVAAEIVPLAIEQGAAVAMQRLHTRSPPKDQG
jgi:peptidyl-tRNA hydrolase, PTH1 family